MSKTQKMDLSIQDRLSILDEAEKFFSDLSDAGETAKELWWRKAAALWTVRTCLDLYQKKILNWEDWTEDTLEQWLATVVDEDYIKTMVETKDMTDEEASFYMGWFGLAVWIIQNDKKAIDWLRELEAQYDEIIDAKLSNKTIADLLK